MNEKNFDYLAEQLKLTGFGDTLLPALKEQLMAQPESFSLNHKVSYGEQHAEAVLNFKRGKDSDMFFFNTYDLKLKNEMDAVRVQQTFYINRENNYTLKEGYNLLSGRAVHKILTNKKDEKYEAWVKMDFKEQTQGGNFKLTQFYGKNGMDLEKVLEKFPIQELKNERYKASLIDSLQRGNLQSATFLLDGKEQKLFITPNLSYKTIHAFDEKGEKVPIQSLGVSIVKEEKETVAKELKQKVEPPKQRQRQKVS